MEKSSCISCHSVNIAVSILSVFANMLVIASILSIKRRTWTLFQMTKLSLAFNDIGVGLSAFASSVLHILEQVGGLQSVPEWLSRYIFIILRAIFAFCGINTYLTLALAAYQRHFAIAKPLKYSNISQKRQVIYILLSWIPGLISSPVLCIALFHEYKTISRWGIVANIICVQIIPFLLTVACTITMLITYWKYTKNNTLQANGGSLEIQRRSQHRKVVKITGFVSAGCVITCTPTIIIMALYFSNVISLNYFTNIYLPVICTLLLINGFWDVAVYIYVDKDFRRFVKRLVERFSCMILHK